MVTKQPVPHAAPNYFKRSRYSTRTVALRQCVVAWNFLLFDCTMSTSSSEDLLREVEIVSPNQLQTSIRNQLISAAASPSPTSLPLHLRGFDFSSSLSRSHLRSLLTSRHTAIISSLDVSHSVLDWECLSELCRCLPQIHSLAAVECRLADTSFTISWPSGLKSLDLSRNMLQNLPGGVEKLLKLEKINLSGNHLSYVGQELLQLPSLKEIGLLNNQIMNIPREICREGIKAMRSYLNIEPLTITPELLKDEHQSLPSPLLSLKGRRQIFQSDSTDSDYYSASLPALSSCTTLSDTDSSSLSPSPLPPPPHLDPPVTYTTYPCPSGYAKNHQNNYCQVLLPRSAGDIDIVIDVIQDGSLFPPLDLRELLATPVVRIEPHGLVFPVDQPALVVLPFCSQPQELLRCTPLCSSTSRLEPPHWEKLANSSCEVHDDFVVIKTTHFSLFAALSFLVYPSVETSVLPQLGGMLTTDHLPGFQVQIAPHSTQQPVLFKATILYADKPYHNDENEDLSLASACIALEPHGISLAKLVTITLPIPDSQRIFQAFPSAQLKLYIAPIAEEPMNWQCTENASIECDGDLAKFQIGHFSFFKFVWTIPCETLRRIRSGASYVYKYIHTQSLSVRCQVLMTPPLPSDLSFGLLVAVFKFGDSLREIGNYKWLLADTGDKKVFLKTGDIQVNLRGKFKPLTHLEEQDMRREMIVSFTGEDFCLRAEFALQLEDLALPIPDWQLLGKLILTQWDGTQCMELNLSKVRKQVTRHQLPILCHCQKLNFALFDLP